MASSRKSVRVRLKEAYISILRKKKYSEVTVTDLVKEADVSRVSYYRSFNSFDEILSEYVDDAYNYIMNNIMPHFVANKEQAWKEFIIKFFTELKNDTLPLPFVLPENTPLLFSKVNAKFAQLFNNKDLNIREKYLPCANLGMLFTIGNRWMKHNFEEPIDAMVEFTYKLVISNLNAV